MNIYNNYVFEDKLVSPINGYICRRINAQNIKNFGFNSIEELQRLYPNFPLRCSENKTLQRENNCIMQNGYKNHSSKLKNNLKTDYYNDPRKCLHCDKIIPFDKRKNRFCNHSCSASYSNNKKQTVSIETRNKISNALAGNQKICKISFCKICGSTIPNRRVNSCSKKCKNKLLSNKVKLAFKEGRHKGNLHRSRISPSYMESSFSDWLIKNKCKYQWIPEHPFKRYDHNGKYERCYFVDFFFPHLKLIIELDGSHHQDQIDYDRDRDNYIVSNYNNVTDIIRITYDEYISLSRIDEIKSLLDIS